MGPFLHHQGHASERRENWTAEVHNPAMSRASKHNLPMPCPYLAHLCHSQLLRNVSAAVGPSSTITLVLSDFPFDVVDDLLVHPAKYLVAWPGEPSIADLADALRYTNRAPPTRGAWAGNTTIEDYSAVLRRLRMLVAPNVDFEIANEPNALSYFWGDAKDFLPIADVSIAALGNRSLPPPSRVTCCAFATEMGCQDLAPGSDNGFIALAKGGAIATRQRHAAAGRFPTALSWHFYRRVSHDADPARSTYANATQFYGREALNGSVISEWGLSTFNSAESAARINSPQLMLELVRLLAFAADVGVAEVDAHCLMDDPHKNGHDCYFDRFGRPRASYFHYELVARTIRGGYTVSGGGARPTNISGVHSGLTIIAVAGDADGRGAVATPFALAPGHGVVAASSGQGFASNGHMLGVGEWIVTQYEPYIKN